jgi:hypothetical protein
MQIGTRRRGLHICEKRWEEEMGRRGGKTRREGARRFDAARNRVERATYR